MKNEQSTFNFHEILPILLWLDSAFLHLQLSGWAIVARDGPNIGVGAAGTDTFIHSQKSPDGASKRVDAAGEDTLSILLYMSNLAT